MDVSAPAPLPVTRLGDDGPVVTTVGLGLAAVGRPAYITADRSVEVGPDRSVDALRARTFEVLDAARDAGIRYVDTARSYGRAEEFLADWLGDRTPGDLVVGSKWGYRYVGDWRMDADTHETKDHSAEAFARQWDETRALLGNAVTLYQVHSATFDTGVLSDAALHHDIARLRDQGVRPGVTVSGPRQAEVVRAALAIDVDGVPLFGTVQATWNLLERSVEPALADAADAGVGVIVKEALANGRLAASDPGRGSPVASLARDTGVTPATLAMAAALGRPWSHVVLSGAVTADQVLAGVAAVGVQLDGAVLDAVDPETPDAYWSARSARPWS